MRCILLMILCCIANVSFALGIGNATVHSAIGEKLVLELPLLGSDGLKQEDALISIGNQADYQALAVNQEYFHHDLRFNLLSTDQAKAVIMVSSNKAVNEPFVHFVIKITTPKETLLRDVMVLLDTH